MTSNECDALINNYENLKQKLRSMNDKIYTCKDNINNCSNYASELIINNKSIDQDVLKNSNQSLSNCATEIQKAIKECNSQISYYQTLKSNILAAERQNANIDANNNKDISDTEI